MGAAGPVLQADAFARDNGVEWVLGGQRHRAEVKLILCLLLDPEFSLRLPIHKDSGLSLGEVRAR